MANSLTRLLSHLPTPLVVCRLPPLLHLTMPFPPPSHTLFSLPLCSPCGKKFRSKPQIARFLGDSHDLTCFDFSRGAYGEFTQRRRARDRQMKRFEPAKASTLVRPLSNNPLRPSGPIRRTCGVIKLPVTWVAPPTDDQAKDSLTLPMPGDLKTQSAIHLIVQSLWEKRLFGVKPYDHVTGDEIAAEKSNGFVEIKPITPISKPHSPRTVSPIPVLTHSPTTGNTAPVPIKSPTCVIPSALRQPLPPPSSAPPLLPTLLQIHHQPLQLPKAPEPHPEYLPSISVIQQTGQPLAITQPSPSMVSQQRYLTESLSLQYSPSVLHNGLSNSRPTATPMVTERELRLQEERVRLLREQLLAAANQRAL